MTKNWKETYSVDIINVVQGPVRIEGIVDNEWSTESLLGVLVFRF